MKKLENFAMAMRKRVREKDGALAGHRAVAPHVVQRTAAAP